MYRKEISAMLLAIRNISYKLLLSELNIMRVNNLSKFPLHFCTIS